MPVGEQRVDEPTGLTGVRADGARGQIDTGTWEARRSEDDGLNARGEDITAEWPRRESDRPIVAVKPGNAGGAKGPDLVRVPKSERVPITGRTGHNGIADSNATDGLGL